MHINGVCEVIAYGRSLGGPPTDRVDLSLRLFQLLALHQQRGDQDSEKAIGGEAGLVSAWRSMFPLVRRGRLHILSHAAIRLWWWLGNSRSHHSEVRWSLSSVMASEISNISFDLFIL